MLKPGSSQGETPGGAIDVAQPFTYVTSMAEQMTVPADGILSRTLYKDDTWNIVLFGFAPGEELSEHTASVPAIIHILQGEARLTLGDQTMEAGPGAWARMDAGLPHSLYAKTPVVMLLTMLR
jgi:quercetin dioxygenase-like cupin family protein